MEPNSSPSLEPGSIKEVTARLLLWGRRAPRGLARVEFTSEFARQEVISTLRKSFEGLGIGFQELELPRNQPATKIVEFLLTHLKELAKGVVSISGFETAFLEDTPLIESLRILNINRENLVVPNICQIWWMTPSTADVFIRDLPDINSWFLLKLELTETLFRQDGCIDTIDYFPSGYRGASALNVDEARHFSGELIRRFKSAIKENQNSVEVFHQLAALAIITLREAKLLQEADQLATRLSKDLPQLTDFEVTARLPDTNVDRYLVRLIMQAENHSALSQFQQATNLLQKALQLANQNLDPENPIFVSILENLGLNYYFQVQLSKAESFFEQALTMKEKIQGPETFWVVANLAEFANFHSLCGNFSEAESILNHAFRVGKNIWNGEETLSLTILMKSLATLYRQQGRYAEAETLFQKALVIQQKLLGFEHPVMADSLNGLARVYLRQKRYTEAEPLFQRAITIQKRHLGNEHPDVATNLQNLANLYQKQERFDEARILLEQAKPILEKALGENHPATKLCVNDLAGLYKDKIA